MPATPSATLPGVLLEGTHAERPSVAPEGALFACSTHGLVYQMIATVWGTYLSGAGNATGLDYVFDNNGSPLATGARSPIEVPFAATVLAWRLFADVSGSIVIDVKRATYSGLPTFASIAASAKPTLSSAQKNQDTTLTGWTTALAAGDWLQFDVTSVATVTKVTLSLSLLRS